MTDTTDTLAELLLRYRDKDDEHLQVPRVSLAEALRTGNDELQILRYFATLGLTVRTLDDLLAINEDETEDDVHCFRVAEGVAVTVASDGLWLLFEP